MTSRSTAAVRTDVTLLGDQDIYLFNEGTHRHLYDRLGAHPARASDGTDGVAFAVWAPNAATVAVVSDFNGWDGAAHPLVPRASSGIWEAFVPGVPEGARYKYRIVSRENGYRVDKADPFAVRSEVPPATASIVSRLDHAWEDRAWMETRARRNALRAPMSIYEVHLGSWRRGEDGRPLGYREVAPLLADHVERLGFTHVEILPVMEHPFYGSWGYQATGFFAPTARYGTPEDLMALIDLLHRRGIGVILDWVPSHFPTDEHGLQFFDGTHLFEHADPRQGFHPDWKSSIFNYGRNEVRAFLISSAIFWLDRYHADGLRVDAVASMLYLDYSRGPGGWIPNRYGGRENLEAIEFLRLMNEAVYEEFPDVQTMAEESTSWPMVSRPTAAGGLGFGLKWDMGFMHDTLAYMGRDPIHRKHHHRELTFRMLYAFHENFVLPLSHDEVVHGKGSLLRKMTGDDWQRFAGLRLLYGYLFGQVGKKLLFMGAELATWDEWNHDAPLAWDLRREPRHAGVARWLSDLARLYRNDPALHERDCEPGGFEWVEADDAEESVISFLRWPAGPEAPVLVACNFTPVPRWNHRIGVPGGAEVWREVLNGDAAVYGGSAQGNLGAVEVAPVPAHGKSRSIVVTLPPLAAVFFRAEGWDGRKTGAP